MWAHAAANMSKNYSRTKDIGLKTQEPMSANKIQYVHSSIFK